MGVFFGFPCVWTVFGGEKGDTNPRSLHEVCNAFGMQDKVLGQVAVPLRSLPQYQWQDCSLVWGFVARKCCYQGRAADPGLALKEDPA